MSFWKRLTSVFRSIDSERTEDSSVRLAFIKEQEESKEPWASFEVVGFEVDGRVKIAFNWNKAFTQKIHDLGFQAETEEDSVQLFFYASQMRPLSLADGDTPVQPENMPNLSSQQNILRT